MPRGIKAQHIELVPGVMDQQSGTDSILPHCQNSPLLPAGWRIARGRSCEQFLWREPLPRMPVRKPGTVHNLAEGVSAERGDHPTCRVAFAGLPKLVHDQLVKRVQSPEVSCLNWKWSWLSSQRIVRVELLGLERQCP